jgi:CBS domain-containing protein/ribosome-associated translation inhibitor RaiA
LAVLIELGNISIQDVMSNNIRSVNRDDQISDIISRMSTDGIHELPVVDDGKAVGIVTYTTLLKARNIPLTSKAEVVMKHFPQLSELDPLTKGIEIMLNSGLNDLPVTKNGKLVGTVYQRDVLEKLTKVRGLRLRQIAEIMTPKVESVREDDDVQKALSIMRGLDEQNLPVLDKTDRLTGVIGMMDILKVIWKPKKGGKKEFKTSNKPVQVLVGSVMNNQAVSVAPDALVEDTIRKMVKKNVSTAFVVEEEELLGVVTLKDFLEQAMSMEEREEGVFVQLTGLSVEDPDVYDSLYSVIQKGLIRISKSSMPKVFNAHIATYNHEGLRSKYSVHARMTCDAGMYYSNTIDWDLYRAMDMAMENLEKEIKKAHEKNLTLRKKGKP